MVRLLLVALLGLSAEACSAPPCDPTVPGSICTIAGNGLAGAGGDDGPAQKAVLYTPQDTAISPSGDLWILDFNNYQVRSIDAAGIIHTQVGTGLLGDSPDPGVTSCPALDAGFNHTPHMLFHDGYLYLAAWHNSRLKRVELGSMMLENYAGIGKRLLYTGDDGPALQAAVDLPSAIAVSPAGEIVFMDQANQVIRRVDADGNIHRVAGSCVVEYLVPGAPCEQGDTLVQCPGSNKTTRCKDAATACGWPCSPSYGGDGGPALEARIAQPFGQAADPAGRLIYDHDGNLLFADTINNRIRKVDKDGVITTVIGTGVQGYSGDGGPASQAQINHPVDIDIAADGTLYFTDTQNNCIRSVSTSGIIDTVAGDCSTAGQCGKANANCFSDVNASCLEDPSTADSCFAGDGGPPRLARLNRPYGVTVADHKLYIADSYNNRVRVVNLP